MLNWALRYEPIVAFLREVRSEPVLEVGSGSAGLVSYRACPVVSVDLELPAPRHPRLRPVRASALGLPFADGAFPTVVSSDMLEHIPAPEREAAIREMVRVAGRYLVVGFPSGSRARAHDVALARTLRRLRVPEPSWLTEHLTIEPPAAGEVAAMAGSSVVLAQRRKNSNAVVHRAVLTGELLPGAWRLTSRVHGMRLARRLAPVLNRGTPYREILVFEKHQR